jgi:uncharacterized RDD family membrane protein YckC
MDSKAFLITVLMVASLLIILYGIVSFVFSQFAMLNLPPQAFIIAFGLIVLLFTLAGAKMFAKD